jgi:hypothetical protein
MDNNYYTYWYVCYGWLKRGEGALQGFVFGESCRLRRRFDRVSATYEDSGDRDFL